MGAGLTFDVGAAIGGRLDAVSEQLGRLVGLGDQRAESRVPIVGSIAGVAGQTAVTACGGPEAGVEWHIRRITFAPQLSAQGAVTTQGTLIIGKGMGLPAQAQGSGQLVAGSVGMIEIARTATVPNAILFSHAQCMLAYPDNLLVAWVSGTGGVSLVIDGTAVQLPANTPRRD